LGPNILLSIMFSNTLNTSIRELVIKIYLSPDFSISVGVAFHSIPRHYAIYYLSDVISTSLPAALDFTIGDLSRI
jgi:hypothetical protein